MFFSRPYVEGCERDGRIPEPADWRVARSIFVADDDVTARRYALDPEGAYGSYYWNLMTKRRLGNALGVFKVNRELGESPIRV